MELYLHALHLSGMMLLATGHTLSSIQPVLFYCTHSARGGFNAYSPLTISCIAALLRLQLWHYGGHRRKSHRSIPSIPWSSGYASFFSNITILFRGMFVIIFVPDMDFRLVDISQRELGEKYNSRQKGRSLTHPTIRVVSKNGAVDEDGNVVSLYRCTVDLWHHLQKCNMKCVVQREPDNTL